MSSRVKYVLVPLMVFFLALPAKAALYGESIGFSDLQDQRTFSEGGLEGYWPYSFTISWDISYDLDSMLWSYEYTLSATRKAVSHFILELTYPFNEEESFISDVMIDGSSGEFEGPNDWNGQGKSNPNLPMSIYGIKFDSGGLTTTYSFVTDLDPVWGNFYAKSGRDSGQWVYAYNSGLLDPDGDDKLSFIPRPDGGANAPIVPEPVSSILFLTGGATLAGRRFWKKRKTSA